MLIFWLGNTATPADFEAVKQFAGAIGVVDGRIVHIIPPLDGRNFSPYLLRNSTHFITTREMVTVECLDWLYDTDVKIISALDEGIFAGEPEILWDKI